MIEKKSSFAITIISACLFAVILSGCGKSKSANSKFTDEQLATLPAPQRSNLPAPSGGLVLAVNNEVIKSEDIIDAAVHMTGNLAKQKNFQEFAETAAPKIGLLVRDRITNILLYQKAMTKVPEKVLEEDGPLDKAVDKEIKKFIAGFGGDHFKAQKELEAQGYDWESFREYKKRLMLIQSFFAEEIDRDKPITHSELIALYNELKDENFKINEKAKFQLIDITADSTSPDRPATKEDARKLAQQVSMRARSGEDFASLIEKYSQGPKAKIGGIWKTSGAGSLVAPYDKVDQKVDAMKVGKVSGAIESSDHFFIVKLLEKQTAGYVPFEDVQQKIENRVRMLKNKQQVDMLVEKLLRQANIGGIEGFLEYCLKQTYIKARNS